VSEWYSKLGAFPSLRGGGMDTARDRAQATYSTSFAIDQRLKPRKRVLLPAVIAFAEGAHRIDCIIHDLSESGARVEFPRDSRFPSVFQLINLKQDVVYDARVVWCGRSEVGLAFI
jgi:hypothetical protein